MMRKPCCEKQDTNKGAWSKHEDQKLIDYIRTHGEGCWSSLPHSAGLLRCGKSCRLRWINYLRPDLKRGNFGEDEEDLIIKLHALLGNRWSLIAGRLPGRTDNEVKNYWNSHLKRKLIRKGIDPNNHRLIYSIPRPQNQNASASAITSASNSHASQTIRSKGDNNIDHLSDVDAASYLEEETISQLPDLNLDLTIIKVPSSTISAKNEEETKHKDSTVSSELVDCDPSPTLLLFR